MWLSRRELVPVMILSCISTAVTSKMVSSVRGSGPPAASKPAVAKKARSQPSLGTGGSLLLKAGPVETLQTSTTATKAVRSANWTLRNVGAEQLRLRFAKACDCNKTNVDVGRVYALEPRSELEVSATSERSPLLLLETSDPRHRQVRLSCSE